MAKRGNGQGAVYLRGDGRWEAQIRLAGGRRKSLYGLCRALYRRSGELLVVGAIGPEAISDRLGFGRAVKAAEERIAAFESNLRRRIPKCQS